MFVRNICPVNKLKKVEDLHHHIAKSGEWSKHSRLFEFCTSEALCIFAHCAAVARLFSLLCCVMLGADEVDRYKVNIT